MTPTSYIQRGVVYLKLQVFSLLPLCLFILEIKKSYSQDIHFSQFYLSPLQYNPAETGFFSGEVRAGGAFRSQWSAVPVSYSTFNFFGDISKQKAKEKYGLGLLFNNDVAGDSKFGTTQLYIPAAYHFAIGNDSSLFFGLGIQPGVSNIGFRTNQLTFDSQFDGDAYNPALWNGENFNMQKRMYFDLNTGIRIQYNLRQRSSITIGASYSHINKPRISFFKNNEIKLDPKFSTYVSFSYPLQSKIDLLLNALINQQGKYKEFVPGLRLSLRIDELQKTAINAGLYLRAKDAVIGTVGLEKKQWTFGISYDINTSKFMAATNRRGAIEFAIIYVFAKEKPFIPKKRACPIYM